MPTKTKSNGSEPSGVSASLPRRIRVRRFHSCAHCKKPLRSRRVDQRYCDSTCRVYALRQRRAAMKKA
jgi:hypothetical protein